MFRWIFSVDWGFLLHLTNVRLCPAFFVYNDCGGTLEHLNCWANRIQKISFIGTGWDYFFVFFSYCSGVQALIVSAWMRLLFKSSANTSFTSWCRFRSWIPSNFALTTFKSTFAPPPQPSPSTAHSTCTASRTSVHWRRQMKQMTWVTKIRKGYIKHHCVTSCFFRAIPDIPSAWSLLQGTWLEFVGSINASCFGSMHFLFLGFIGGGQTILASCRWSCTLCHFSRTLERKHKMTTASTKKRKRQCEEKIAHDPSPTYASPS